jgi:hypothetical protein
LKEATTNALGGNIHYERKTATTNVGNQKCHKKEGEKGDC